jgi:hypothetical protein
MNRHLRLSLLLLPLLLPGCGGGSSGAKPSAPTPPPVPVRGLHYTNPPAQGFRLEALPATNGTPHLVLQLRGPKDLPVGGVAFFVNVEGDRAAWAPLAGKAGFFRYEGALGPGTPSLARARVRGSALEVGVFTSNGIPAAPGEAPILSVALDLKPGAAPGPVTLATPPGRGAVYLDGQRLVAPFPGPLGLGTLDVK